MVLRELILGRANLSPLRKWSLNKLLELNANYNHQVGLVTGEVADIILQDVNARLAAQQLKIWEMMDHITSPKSFVQPLASKPTGIIRAVNHSLNGPSIQELVQQNERLDKYKKVAMKNLLDLHVLHTDTFKLTEHLLSNQKPTINRFSNADRNLLAATIEQIRSRHAQTVEALADISISMRHYERLKTTPLIDEHIFNNFLKDRLGIQLLCDHYIAFDKGKSNGGVSVNCDLRDILTDAIHESKHICDANFGIVPEVEFIYKESHKNHSTTVIRPWVHHSLVELLKNSMTSSVQRNCSSPPTIYVDIEERNVDDDFLVCKIIDQGIGLENIQEAFRFASSSAQTRWDRIDEQQSYASVRSPISSLGVGLTLSKMMTRMFGGDVTLLKRPVGLHVTFPNSESRLLDSGITAVFTLPLSSNIEEWSRLQ